MINVNTGFSSGSKDAIDSRIVLTKEEMLNINENTQPDVYFATCLDDGKLYIYNKDNPNDAETGKFKVVEGGGAVIEITDDSELPNPPELNVYVTKHKEIVTTDMSSLWSYDSTFNKYAITFRISRDDHFIIHLSNNAIVDLDYSSPSEEWIKKPDPYKDTFYYRYSGDTSEIKDAPSPCAIVKSLSTNTATGGSLIFYAITIYADQPYSFEIESNYKPTYYYNVSANGNKEINPLCTKAISDSTEYSLDKDFTIPGFEYTAETRTVKNTTSKSMIFETIIEVSEHKTEDVEMQAWVRDVELATKEFVLTHGGGKTEDYLTYSSDAFDTLATHTYNIDEYTNDEIDALFNETAQELEELSQIINDNLKSKFKLWSSQKVADEIAQSILDSNAYADGLIGNISSISLEVVTSLPTQGASNIIYILQLSDKNTLNVYSNGSWVEVGNLNVDFSDYYNKAKVDELLATKADADNVISANNIKQDLTNPNDSDVLSTFGVNKVVNEINSSLNNYILMDKFNNIKFIVPEYDETLITNLVGGYYMIGKIVILNMQFTFIGTEDQLSDVAKIPNPLGNGASLSIGNWNKDTRTTEYALVYQENLRIRVPVKSTIYQVSGVYVAS